MATMLRAFLILLPPMSVLLLLLAAAARNLRALACLPVGGGSSSFWRQSINRAMIGEALRVAPYRSRRRLCSCSAAENNRGAIGKEEEEAVECVLCLSGIEEGEEIRELKCQHLFHRTCLDRWLARAAVATCPLCRCRLLAVAEEEVLGEEEEEEEEASNMMLFMACVNGHSSWFWPSS